MAAPKTLHVENFPEGLLKIARAKANEEGRTLRAYVILAIHTRTLKVHPRVGVDALYEAILAEGLLKGERRKGANHVSGK